MNKSLQDMIDHYKNGHWRREIYKLAMKNF